MAITIINGITAIALTLESLFNERTVTGGASLTSADNYVYVNNQTASGINLTLPANPLLNQPLFIKDVAGNAQTNNITIIGVVDGATNPIIGSNYGGAYIVWTGTAWAEIA